MKILLLPAYFSPEHVAGSYLNSNRNQAFANAGFFTETYVPTPCRGISTEKRTEYCKKEHRCEKMYDDHMTVHRFSMYTEGKNPALRALRYALCWIKQFNRGLQAKDIDCIFLVSTPPIQGMLGAFLKMFKRVPFVYNLQDIFPDTMVGAGLTKEGSLLWKIGRVIEKFTYKHSDKIIVISEGFKRNIMAKGVPESKIEVIYNWVDENAVVPVPDEENPLFEEVDISRETFRVVYAGNLGNAQNIDIIMDAARRLKDNPKVQFVIFGTGGLEDKIKAAKEREQLDNLKILPLQPYERVSQVFSLGSVCVVSCNPGLGGAAMPSKTWTIMSAGRPVLASFDEGELQDIIEGRSALLKQDGPCGVFTKAGDTDAFCAAILNLCENPDLCRQYGANGRRFILNNLTKEVGTRRYVEVIKGVVGMDK